VWEEKHLIDPPKTKTDKITHLYTLHVRPDNSFDIEIDGINAISGNLLENFKPSVNPPKDIDDPTDKKPKDWVDIAEIPDPTATKPDDWDESQPASLPDETAVKPNNWLEDEPEEIPDPTFEKPEDWSDEDDGEFVAPSIPNPKCADVAGCGPWKPPAKSNPLYRGKWKAPLIPNPDYIGPWSPRKIPNPNYFEDLHPHKFKSMVAVGIEVWQMSKGIMFDNILITSNKAVADLYAEETFHKKQEEERRLNREDTDDEDISLFGRLISLTQSLQEVLENFVIESQRNPWIGIATAVSILIPLGVCFMAFSADKKKERPRERKAEETKKEAEKEKKEEEKAEVVEKTAGQPEPKGAHKKKKTPKE